MISILLCPLQFSVDIEPLGEVGRWALKERGGCLEGMVTGKPRTIVLAVQANCKIADLLCLAECSLYIWNIIPMTWLPLRNLLWKETSELGRPLAFSPEGLWEVSQEPFIVVIKYYIWGCKNLAYKVSRSKFVLCAQQRSNWKVLQMGSSTYWDFKIKPADYSLEQV